MFIHFYGDSWTVEHDVEAQVNPCVGYPSMIGNMLNIAIRNHALPGNSQLCMVNQFVNTTIAPGDHAVFSMSSPSRRFYLDETNKSKNISFDGIKEACNDYQDSWLSAMTCALINNLAKHRNCQVWFVNLFNVSYQEEWAHALWDYIPRENWLLPPDHCLVQDLFDPEWFVQFTTFRNSDFNNWLATNNNEVKACIRPCLNHPNLEGRTRIAHFIAGKLKIVFDKGKFL